MSIINLYFIVNNAIIVVLKGGFYMPDSQLTKKALSAAMKKLMEQKPMEKIRIKEIVGLCNMHRQSFYYHFKDKYDLVNWIFYTEFIESIQDLLENPSWELFEKMCEFFYENRVFYSNALQVTGQNSFSEYFNEVMQPIIASQVSDIFEEDPDKDFYAEFLTDAIRVAITKWLSEGAKIPPGKFARLIKNVARIGQKRDEKGTPRQGNKKS